jgi:hypothetical protein
MAYRKKVWLSIAIVACLCIGLGVGVGVGVGVNRHNKNNRADPQDTLSGQDVHSFNSSGAINNSLHPRWIPTNGELWNYQLASPFVDISDAISIYDIDLEDVSAEQIAELKAAKKKVICYFSAGSYESWRQDSTDFDERDLGKPLTGWEGERWLNISSPNVHEIMRRRIKLAAKKHCDAIDPDNVNAYSQSRKETGFNITFNESKAFIVYLACEAHSHNMSIALKNCPEMVKDVVDIVDFAVSELCVEFDECNMYLPIAQKNHAIFHVEYPKGDKDNSAPATSQQIDTYCDFPHHDSFSTILKNLALNEWIYQCSQSKPKRLKS